MFMKADNNNESTRNNPQPPPSFSHRETPQNTLLTLLEARTYSLRDFTASFGVQNSVGRVQLSEQ
jgi:hypothetical protein